MDIAGTKKKIQRATTVAEESYKKMNEMLERMQEMEEDLQTTSTQVDHIEYELAEQRALLEAVAREQGLDVDDVLSDAELPAPPSSDTQEEEPSSALAEMATSRPSASTDGS